MMMVHHKTFYVYLIKFSLFKSFQLPSECCCVKFSQYDWLTKLATATRGQSIPIFKTSLN